jgi:hypothetical protein
MANDRLKDMLFSVENRDGDYLVFISGHPVKHTYFTAKIDFREIVYRISDIEVIRTKLSTIGVAIYRDYTFVNLTVLNKHADSIKIKGE